MNNDLTGLEPIYTHFYIQALQSVLSGMEDISANRLLSETMLANMTEDAFDNL